MSYSVCGTLRDVISYYAYRKKVRVERNIYIGAPTEPNVTQPPATGVNSFSTRRLGCVTSPSNVTQTSRIFSPTSRNPYQTTRRSP